MCATFEYLFINILIPQTTMATSAANKAKIGLSGEFGTASELCKRGFNPSITMGTTKAVDIIITDDARTKIKRIEVKTTNKGKIVTSFFKKYYDKSIVHPDYWVLVYIDSALVSHYYVLTHDEVGDIQMKVNDLDSWPTTASGGVDNIPIKMLEESETKWDKISI